MSEQVQSLKALFLGGDKLLFIPEVAELLRVSHKTIRRMITDGKLRSGKLRGKRIVRLSDINALVHGSVT